MREEVIWTNLSVVEISKRLEEEYQIKVSKTVIYKLLKKHKYGPATGPVDEQELTFGVQRSPSHRPKTNNLNLSEPIR